MQISPINTDSRAKLDMRPGDTVKVFQKIQEKDKTRLQAFEGMVLARKHGTEAGATFTVRRSTGGFGVEKIFPLYSPMIDRIEIVKRSKVRRSKLYYIREKALKQASKRLKMMFVDIKTEDEKIEEAPVMEEEATQKDVTASTVADEVVAKEEVADAPSEAPVEEQEVQTSEAEEAPVEETPVEETPQTSGEETKEKK